MSRAGSAALVAVVLVALVPSRTVAQSLQRLSIQGSGAAVFPTSTSSDFQNDTRLGWEGQLRYTFSRFSLGAGYQRSTVYKLQDLEFSASVPVIFLEPRYVAAASSSVAFYLAGRVGVGSLECSPSTDCVEQDMELAYGGGGGLLFALSERIAVDLGSQYFTTRFTPSVSSAKTWSGYVLARLGLSIGL